MVLAAVPAPGQEESWEDRLHFNGWVGGSYQLQRVSGVDDEGGAFLFRPSLDFDVTGRDRLHVSVALPSGDGLNLSTPFLLSPWAADLQDGVTLINGSGRSHLLTAWYSHAIELAPDDSLALTAGLIDATDYLDQNAYSNDELSQFMNAALVNGPNGFAPSYDLGGALEWRRDAWNVNGVAMHIYEGSSGSGYGYLGAQVGYRADTRIGEGNYRVYLGHETGGNLDTSGSGAEARTGVFLSADQELGEVCGVWTRSGLTDRNAAVRYASTLSGGLNVNGRLWGRGGDELGLGTAYLNEGNTGVLDSLVVETYLRVGLYDGLAVTLDAQYMRDRYELGAGSDVQGWILGLRLGLGF